jgi:hypothetical protein
MCPDCRRERLTGRPTADFARELADAIAPGRVIEAGVVDHAMALSQDLQNTLSRIRRVALTWEDAAALYRAASRNGRLAAPVAVRVAEALTEAFAAEPSLRPGGANAIAPRPEGSDHGRGPTTSLTNSPTTG